MPRTLWLCKQKRKAKGVRRERDLSGMPESPLPVLPDAQFSLPELVGLMFNVALFCGVMLFDLSQTGGACLPKTSEFGSAVLCVLCVLLRRLRELLQELLRLVGGLPHHLC